MAKWMLRRNKIDSVKVANAIGKSDIVVDILANRGINGEEEMLRFLNPSMENMHEPTLMKDMDKGVSIVKRHIDSKSTIAVYGDYDVGAMRS